MPVHAEGVIRYGAGVCWWACRLWSQGRLWRAEVEDEAPFVGPEDSATFDPCCGLLLEWHGLWCAAWVIDAELFIRALGPRLGGGGGEGESGEDAVEEEGVEGFWWGTWDGVGVAVAALESLEKALLDGAGEGDDHLGWTAELGGFEIDAAMADAASENCNESLPGHACGFALSLWWGAAEDDEDAVGGDAWRCMSTVHEDVADVFGGAGAVEVPA